MSTKQKQRITFFEIKVTLHFLESPQNYRFLKFTHVSQPTVFLEISRNEDCCQFCYLVKPKKKLYRHLTLFFVINFVALKS